MVASPKIIASAPPKSSYKEEFLKEGQIPKKNEKSHSIKVSSRMDKYLSKINTEKALVNLGKETALKEINKDKKKLKYKSLMEKCEELKDFDPNFFISKIRQIEIIPKKAIRNKWNNDETSFDIIMTKDDINNLRLFKVQMISVIGFINCFVLLTQMNYERINKLREKVKEYKEDSETFEEQCENYIKQLDAVEDELVVLKKYKTKYEQNLKWNERVYKFHKYSYSILICLLAIFYYF